MYGIVKEYLRLSDDEFTHGKNRHSSYVFVQNGFFRPRNVITPLPFGILWIGGHFLYILGVYRVLTQHLWLSWIINFWYGSWGGLSVTGGNHRLWCHRSYDAKAPLRLFLMLGQTMTGQYTAHSWSVGHRIHHKYSDTDADPHNTKRGFLFAHIGWLFRTEHPDVTTKERLFQFTDLDHDNILLFQNRHYYSLYLLMSVIVPMTLQVTIAGDCLLDAFLLAVVMRNISVYHDTAFVNSAAHMFGDRPYNGSIDPRENYYVSLAAFGEGYHNYHHSFPWDYKAGETGAGFNLTSVFIEFMAKIGQASNLRVASSEVITAGRMKTLQARQVKNVASTDVDDLNMPEGKSANSLSTGKVAAVAAQNKSNFHAQELQVLPHINATSLSTWAKKVIKLRGLNDESCEFL